MAKKSIDMAATALIAKENILRAAVQNIIDLKTMVKNNYEAIEDNMILLANEGVKAGDRFTLKDGTVLEYVDNFAEKSVVYRPAGVRRFELVPY